MSISAGPGRSPSGGERPPKRRRLLGTAPVVFFGSEAHAALAGGRGLLLGEKRHGQVDVFSVAPHAGELASLLAARLAPGPGGGWAVVGVALGDIPAAGVEQQLLDGLVAGDLVVADGVSSVWVHTGDRLRRCRVTGFTDDAK